MNETIMNFSPKIKVKSVGADVLLPEDGRRCDNVCYLCPSFCPSFAHSLYVPQYTRQTRPGACVANSVIHGKKIVAMSRSVAMAGGSGG